MIRSIEEMSMNALPAYENMIYDGWIMRFTKGYKAKRANSVYPLYKSTYDVNEKIKKCEEIYSSKGLDTVFKMTDEACPSNLDAILDKRGYKIDSPTSVQVLNLCNIQEPENEDIIISTSINNQWFGFLCAIDNIPDKNRAIQEEILKNIIPQKYFVLLQREDRIVGCGLGVVDNDFIGIYSIAVDKEYRNKGYGKEIVLNLLKMGKVHGAKKAYLQVMLNNLPALKLYSGIGFKEEYRYWYRVKEESHGRNKL